MFDEDDLGYLARDVGRRLEQYRTILGVNQMEFGAAAGLKQSRYHAFEKGTRLLTLRSAFKLCQRYNLTLDYLYLGDTSMLPRRIADQLQLIKNKK